MKNAFVALLLVVIGWLPTAASAQTAAAPPPTQYVVFGYHKVTPDHREEFLKLAKAWKKIVASKKKAGLQEDWSIARVVSPMGASTEYNYVTRHALLGDDQLANNLEKPFLPEGWQALLTVEEIALVLRANEIRTFVKNEVWSNVDEVIAPDISKSTVTVVNFFKQPTGKLRADHIKMEQDIWKPVHAARIKEGTMKGWIFLNLEMPFGSEQPYDMITVDVFTDMKQMLAPWFDAYFKKVHPGKDVPQLMKQTSEATNLVRGEVRVIIDRLDW